MRRRISRAQQTKNWCVGFLFPPPAYAGIHPTLYLFGFRANALNSHSPSYLPGFDPGSGFGRFGGFRGVSGGLRKPDFGAFPRNARVLSSGAAVGFGSGFRVFWGPLGGAPAPAPGGAAHALQTL